MYYVLTPAHLYVVRGVVGMPRSWQCCILTTDLKKQLGLMAKRLWLNKSVILDHIFDTTATTTKIINYGGAVQCLPRKTRDAITKSFPCS